MLRVYGVNEMKKAGLFTMVLLVATAPSNAQWSNRYPKIEGYRHHVYIEGFELPVMGTGPTDPAPSPDGGSIAFAARGWLWLLDLESGEARRLTRGGAMDSRPAWSADGKRLAFLRDDTVDIDLFVFDLETGRESPLVETEAIELDPAFSPDGKFLYYSSAKGGDLDIWRLDLTTNERVQITSDRGLELRPQPLPGGGRIVYLSKGRSSPDSLVELNIEDKSARTLATQSIASQTFPDLSPDGKTLVVNWPGRKDYDLLLMDLAGGDTICLDGDRHPLSPVFSSDGETIFFVEANDELRFELFRIPRAGGKAEKIAIRSWEWAEATGKLRIKTRIAGDPTPVPSRLHIVDGKGHPALSEELLPRFDSAHGKVFTYSPGILTFEVPAGDVRVLAARGFSSPAVSATGTVAAGEAVELDLMFEPIWEPRREGWYAGDLHYHMNYGGPYRLHPEDLVLPLAAEDMDVGTPLMANLHHRLRDTRFSGWRRLSSGPPLIEFGQEVRSHFLGHLGLVHITSPFWPWFWGPGYPVYGADDRPNQEALAHARKQGSVSSYMHPVSIANPFDDETTLQSIPLSLIPDAVLGDLDSLELACIYISELGTHEVWYRFLNIGVPVAASAGTDSFASYFRSFAVGATRVYVHVGGPLNMESFLQALKRGRSFVSTGPLLTFTVNGAEPGDVVGTASGKEISWEMAVASPLPVETVEVLLNGVVIWKSAGLAEPGKKTFQGSIEVPQGGWIAARVHGGREDWPGMNGYPFAHTSPVWFHSRGSTDPDAARRSAHDLLRALDVAEKRLADGYGDAPIPRNRARFSEARQKLEQFIQGR